MQESQRRVAIRLAPQSNFKILFSSTPFHYIQIFFYISLAGIPGWKCTIYTICTNLPVVLKLKNIITNGTQSSICHDPIESHPLNTAHIEPIVLSTQKLIHFTDLGLSAHPSHLQKTQTS